MRLICDSETCLFLSAASRRPPQPSASPAEPSGPNSSESVQYKYTEYSQFYVATARAVESIRVVVNLYFEVFSSGRYWCSYFFSLNLVFPTNTVTCVSRWNPTAFLTLKHLQFLTSLCVCSLRPLLTPLRRSLPPPPPLLHQFPRSQARVQRWPELQHNLTVYSESICSFEVRVW